MQRGTCSFRQKADNARVAAATAAVIFNRGGGADAAFQGTLGTPGVGIPVIGTSIQIAQGFYNLSLLGHVSAHVQTTTKPIPARPATSSPRRRAEARIAL